MIALDTNVLARWVLRDDEAQFRAAETLLAGPFWLSWTVVLELGWLLQSYAGLGRNALSDVIETIMALPEVQMDRPDNLRWALARFRAGGDWADMVHIASTGQVSAFVSFEKRLARQAGKDSPVPVDRAG